MRDVELRSMMGGPLASDEDIIRVCVRAAGLTEDDATTAGGQLYLQ